MHGSDTVSPQWDNVPSSHDSIVHARVYGQTLRQRTQLIRFSDGVVNGNLLEPGIYHKAITLEYTTTFLSQLDFQRLHATLRRGTHIHVHA